MGFITDTIAFILKSPFIIVGWLIVGAVAGDLARRFMGSKDQGCLSDWLLGILGAMVGGFIASIFQVDTPDGGIGAVLASLVVATIGAAILIFIRRAVTGNRAAKAKS